MFKDPKQSARLFKLSVIVVIVILALSSLFPFIWMVLTSFKTQAEINLMPPTFIPETWNVIENYTNAWMKPESTFGRYFINTLIIAGFGTLVQLVICIPIAFAITHFRFPGRNFIFILVLATMMIPYDVTLIPNFITIRHMPLMGGNDIFGQGGQGLYDSYSGMVLPFIADAFTVFLLRQAFLTVSKDYWLAAQVDGMSHFGYLWRVLVPISWPTIITAGLLSFIGKWNGVLWPLLITSSEHLRPLQVGLLYFISEEGHYYHLLMAAATFTVLPIVLLYFVTQKWFNNGIAGTGLK
ncbi:carbohydrate ABC transporter permease [Mesobacillus stamsii]|uniref:Multiple sugar transport system permease protein n=1 Tax=Mesobacillus stamsii TaxID=225347 RepID=A0ABU0G1G3_9BACI|nr:carbohydrate ABC transporter permease [Mesobacillus stamsii]MDQ0415780.1 multiple sugar transport system permease protein [Mesobacillus stamsii]